jgi:AraC-like DNA-binding protein
MIEFEFDSENLSAADRFNQSRELMSQLPAPFDASTEHPAGFRLYQRDLHLDTLRVWTMSMQPMVLHRTAKLVRQSDPETYNIVVLEKGVLGRTWGRREATYGRHDLHTNDSSQPYELWADNARGLISCTGVELPKKLLPLPQHRIDMLVGQRLPGQDGVGALLRGFLGQLNAGIGSYLPSDDLRLSTILVDLVSALFAHALEADDILPPETRQGGLVLRIRAFIEQHLHDPGLRPGAVAAAHYISTSYLHRLFQSDGTTVGAWIRQRRLEHARRDLADRAMATVPIGDIAARWGFRHPAAFSRAFRAAYGITPKDYRLNERHGQNSDYAMAPTRGVRGRSPWMAAVDERSGRSVSTHELRQP